MLSKYQHLGFCPADLAKIVVVQMSFPRNHVFTSFEWMEEDHLTNLMRVMSSYKTSRRERVAGSRNAFQGCSSRPARQTSVYIEKASNTTTSSHLMTACDKHLHSLFLAFPTTEMCFYTQLVLVLNLFFNANLFFFPLNTQGQISWKVNTFRF